MFEQERLGLEITFPDSFIDPSSLSLLAKLFVEKAQYAQITTEEALGAVYSLLNDLELDESLCQLVFESLANNRILLPSSPNIYLINDRSEQAVLVNLTECYSPTCTSDGCYSPTCPKKSFQKLDIHDAENTARKEDTFTKIPRYILEELEHKEKNRQLAIEEFLNLEQGYLKQFNFVRENFAIPLLESQTTIEQDRRYQFHSSLFRNYLLLSSFHLEFHQKLEAIREPGTFLFPNEIADIILQHVKLLEEPYIRYATNHVFAIHNFKMECNKNVAFANFVTEQQNINKDFRLPLTNYLLVPTQKLGKYRLLLTTLLKYLEDQEECHILLEIDQLLNSILHKMNEATRDAEAEQRLYDIKLGLRVANRRTTSTTFKFPHHLLSENATLLLEASLTYWTKLSIATSTCHIFLFSDKFFITRTKILDSGMTEYTLIERAIPIAMLQFSPKSRSRILTQQGTFLSSLRHQLGSTSNYPSHIPSPTSLSDDASSTYSTVRTISGLRIRHRFRRMKNSIKRHSSVSVGPSKHLYGKKGLDKLQQQQDMVPQRMASPHVVRSKHFQIYHKAYPDLSYHFECNTAEDRQQWRSMIKSVLATPNNGPFDLRGICSVPNGSNLPKVNGRYPTGCGTIWCTLPFTTKEGREVIALGTRYGVWVAYRDGSEEFRQIIQHNCHQLELYDNKILLARVYNPNRILGAIRIDSLFPPSNSPSSIYSGSTGSPNDTKDFQILQKSGVLSFAVGTVHGQNIVCYLRRRRTGSVRLVVMLYRVDASSWFKKFGKEYKLRFDHPKELKIINDMAYIRSRHEGIERVDIGSWILNSSGVGASQSVSQKYSSYIYLPHSNSLAMSSPAPTYPTSLIEDSELTTLGFLPLIQPGTGLIYSEKTAWPFGERDADLLQSEINFEANIKSAVIVYPYLVAFSNHVIEIRHLETTEIVQTIEGNSIRCVYVSHIDPAQTSSPRIIHVTMFHQDEDQTKVYQLFLNEPIVLEE